MLVSATLAGCTGDDLSDAEDPAEGLDGTGGDSAPGGSGDPDGKEEKEGPGDKDGEGKDAEDEEDGEDGNGTDDPDDPDDGEGDGDNSTGDGNFTLPDRKKKGSSNESEEESSDPWAGDDPQWPPVSQALVRPGVRVTIATEQCTSNFVFRDRADGDLFLGLAAHCVHGMPQGQQVSIYGIDGDFVMKAPVNYSSWRAIGFDPDQAGPVEPDVHPHDFALLKIPREKRELVHPAVVHYQGPTGLAGWEDPSFGDMLFAYGNSGMRPVDDLDPQSGFYWDSYSYTVQGTPGYSVVTHMVSPPMPGDSGSPLLTAQGEALGVLSSVTLGTPYGAWWEYSSLPHALDAVREHKDRDIVLGTWDEFTTDL